MPEETTDPNEPERTVRLPLVGLVEIAQRAGVRRPVVSVWRTRHADFPEAVQELHVGPVFSWPEVKEWLILTGREYDAHWSLEQVRTPGRSWPTKPS